MRITAMVGDGKELPLRSYSTAERDLFFPRTSLFPT